MDFTKLSISELVDYEKAAETACRHYENAVRDYTGGIDRNSTEFSKFDKLNRVHLSIIDEITNRLLKN